MKRFQSSEEGTWHSLARGAEGSKKWSTGADISQMRAILLEETEAKGQSQTGFGGRGYMISHLVQLSLGYV